MKERTVFMLGRSGRWLVAGKVLAVVLLIAGSIPTESYAQAYARVEQIEENTGAYYHFITPGTPSVQIYVMGAVSSPGIYEVSQDTDLGKVLALAKANIGNKVTVSAAGKAAKNDIIVRLFRDQPTGRSVIFEKEIQEIIQHPNEYPALQDNDVVTVEIVERRKIGWRDLLSVAQTIAILSLAADRLGIIN